MSQETTEWLNNNVLLGFTEDRDKWASNMYAHGGRAWWQADDYNGGFPGAVPVEEIVKRLFNWQAISASVFARVPCDDLSQVDGLDADGNGYRVVPLPEHQAILRSDTDHCFKVFSDGYDKHQYEEWLLQRVDDIIGDELQCDSAMLLQSGGVAAVSVSLPESLSTSVDFAIRPRILAYTSLNGRFTSTYQRSIDAPVCDNSLDFEIGRADEKLKIKHTRYSNLKVAGAREALGLIYRAGEEDVAFFEALAKWEVSNAQFADVVDALDPMPEPTIENGKVTNGATITRCESRRGEVTTMYLRDPRVAPWQGSALGTVQAFNTWHQQERGNVQKNSTHFERRMVGTLTGEVAKYDDSVLDAVATVTGWAVKRQTNGAFDLVSVS